MSKSEGTKQDKDASTPTGPDAIRVTPEGRREVDPMSIIGSKAAKEHLREIKEIKPQRPESSG